MKKLAIVITHPIQYYVPVIQLLVQQCQVKVFYTWGEAGVQAKHDPGFGKTIAWDMPLLTGYDYELLNNTAAHPGSHHGKGVVNPGLIQKVTAFAPDAILVYGYIYHSHFQVMRYFKGKIPILFRGDSTLLDPLPWYKAIAKKLYLSWVYRYIDIAFYVGTQNKAYFKRYGLKENQLIFSPHAVDNDRFAVDRQAEADELRKKLQINQDDILILFAGKFEPKKNPELLLQAFIEMMKETEVRCQMSEDNDITKTENEKDLPSTVSSPLFIDTTATNNEQPCLPYRQGTTNSLCNPSIGVIKRETKDEKRPRVHLLFVGNGDLEERLKLSVKNYPPPTPSKGGHELSNNIHFMDFQNQTQIPVVYQACDLFCLPSQGPGETWGLAVNEAMASGKAILVSNKVGCAIDLVENGNNGYIFESENVADLKTKLTLLIQNKQPLIDMGSQSLNLIENWNITQQANAILKELNN